MTSATRELASEWPKGSDWNLPRSHLEHLRTSKRSAAARVTLDRIEWAIGTLVASDGNITAKNVARLCTARWGGPAAQSIANDPAGYAELIRLAAAAMGKKRPIQSANAGDDLIARVADPAARAEVQILISENRVLRAKLTTLLSALRRVRPLGRITEEMARARISDLDALAAAIEANVRPGGISFTPEEVANVEAFLTDITKEGISTDERSGELITTRHGRRFARAGVTSSLRKIAGLRGGDQVP